MAVSLLGAVGADMVLLARDRDAGHDRAFAVLARVVDGQPRTLAVQGPGRHTVYGGETFFLQAPIAEALPLWPARNSLCLCPVDGAQARLAVLMPTGCDDLRRADATIDLAAAGMAAAFRAAWLSDEKARTDTRNETRRARLQRQLEALHEANAFKTRLLGVIAHDLRNPLTAMMSQIEVMEALVDRRPETDPRLKAKCARMTAIADRMSELIKATLERVRCESASLGLCRQRTDITALVRTVVQVNAEAAERKRIAVICAVEGRVDAHVDPSLIFQVIDNLVGNALKYTWPKGRVWLELVTAEDGTAIVRVRDTGQGLSVSDLRRVFRHFQTLSARPTGGESSVGLGLANVREIVTAHGGTVTARSPGVGRGATFEVRLPHHATA